MTATRTSDGMRSAIRNSGMSWFRRRVRCGACRKDFCDGDVRTVRSTRRNYESTSAIFPDTLHEWCETHEERNNRFLSIHLIHQDWSTQTSTTTTLRARALGRHWDRSARGACKHICIVTVMAQSQLQTHLQTWRCEKMVVDRMRNTSAQDGIVLIDVNWLDKSGKGR